MDLLRCAHNVGSIDAIATVFADLGDKIDSGKLVALAPVFERSVIQRLGYLLDRVGPAEQVTGLHGSLSQSQAADLSRTRTGAARGRRFDHANHRRRGKSRRKHANFHFSLVEYMVSLTFADDPATLQSHFNGTPAAMKMSTMCSPYRCDTDTLPRSNRQDCDDLQFRATPATAR